MLRMAIIACAALYMAGADVDSAAANEPSPQGSQTPDSLSANVQPATVPRAVTVARTARIPRCSVFVDAAAMAGGDGSVQRPHRTIAAAVASARPGAIICVAEGMYPESLSPGEKHFILAGGFRRGTNFTVRDSAAYVSRAIGRGSGSFIRYDDPAPKGNQLTAIDGFEITGYSQAIVRDTYYSQRFDITNNHIHGNRCATNTLAGAGFALNNTSGWIAGNVIRNNVCGRGGAGFVNDTTKENTVSIERNLIDNNAGNELGSSHGGALYLFGTTLRITGNLFTRNTVTGWGAGLYIGADTGNKQFTTAQLNWNFYRGNSAGIAGGGMFCDDGASCRSFHEIYDRNCGGNVYLDGSGVGLGPTTARFAHLTNVRGLAVGCNEPGPGVRIDGGDEGADNYAIVDAIFWGNGTDIAANCDRGCGKVRIAVSYAMVQANPGVGFKITYGEGIMAPTDPLFASPDTGDFHLKSIAGRWTSTGRVSDPVNSPALAKGYPGGKPEHNPQRVGDRNELGAYGNSVEASYVR